MEKIFDLNGTQFIEGNGKRLTQYDRVLRHLQTKRSITSLQAFRNYGITRLSAIIFNLRRDGYIINNEYVSRKNRYDDTVVFAKYILVKE